MQFLDQTGLPSYTVSLTLILFTLTIWTTSHYWRILTISWFAVLSITLHLMAYWRRMSIFQLAFVCFLVVTLFLWSLLLTPVQLILQRQEAREPSAAYQILYDPAVLGVKQHDIKFDVIAIHGLGSWPELTWTASNGVNWLRDLLPEIWTDMRIVAINHNSRWDAHSPVQSLRDYGQTLLTTIEQIRRHDVEQNRPIIMVGHSFGGILAKKALVVANEAQEGSRSSKIAKTTGAVFFLGTPHKGSNFALLGTLSSYFSYWRGSRSDLLEFLTPSSKELEDLHFAFLRAFNTTYICNFFETIPVKLGDLPWYPVVSYESATIEGFPIIPIEAEHRGLNKFTNLSDGNFQLVRHEIGNARDFITNQLAGTAIRNQYTVPFRLRGAARIGNFIGRKDLLVRLRDQMQLARNRHRQGTLVLTGLGGIGKSQLAIEFAIQNQEDFTAAFWVDCHSASTARQAFAGLAEQIPLPSVLGPDGHLRAEVGNIEAAVRAVTDWLEATANKRWLLIFDNVDSHPRLGDSADSQHAGAILDVRELLPSSPHGTVLITTRLSRLTQLGSNVEVREVSAADGLAIFENCVGFPALGEDAEKLVKLLEGLPLAICQAGVYIKESGISISGYLKAYSSLLDTLLQEDNDLSYRNGSIRVSLEISTKELEKRDPVALSLLRLWGFLDNVDLWHGLLKLASDCPNDLNKLPFLTDPAVQAQSSWQTAGEPFVIPNNPETWLDAIARDQLKFLDAIRSLREFSLVRPMNDTDGYSIHPIVQEFARKSVPKSLVPSYLGTAIEILGRAAPLAHAKDAWILHRRLSPHIDRVWKIFDEENGTVAPTLSATEGFYGLSYYEFDRSNFSRAAIAYDRASQGLQKFLGLKDRLTIQCLHDEGLVFRVLGEYERAAERWEWSSGQGSKVEGPLSRTALRGPDDLGRLAAAQGNHEEAARYLEKAWEGKKQAWQHDPLYVYDTARHLGLAYMEVGRLDEAEPLQMDVRRVFEEELGQTHPWTLLATSDLAALYQRQGKLLQAEILLKSAFEAMFKALGPLNDKTKEVFENLRTVLEAQGKFEELQLLRSRMDLGTWSG